MPWPDNASMACDVEDIVRKEGATPATIAIVGGKLCVGLEEEQLTTLGTYSRSARGRTRSWCTRA
ncbi:hypothetical protein EON66_03925 [archaeon]|nr:MAG: hypothetical protein EON66_03925 [archaeon]